MNRARNACNVNKQINIVTVFVLFFLFHPCNDGVRVVAALLVSCSNSA